MKILYLPLKAKWYNMIDSGGKGGLCNTERSMISPDYARNFICDFIIGKQQVFTQTNLFD